MSRKHWFAYCFSKDGRELQEQNNLEYGHLLVEKDKQEVKVGTNLVEWDANNRVILTENAGTVKYVDLIENVTVQERYDEATNVSIKLFLNIRVTNINQQSALLIKMDRNSAVLFTTGSY